MASIKLLDNGKYQATVYIGRDANGKQDKKRKTFDSERKAKKWARDLETEIEERKYTNMDKVRASTWFNDWLEANKNHLSPPTYISYKMYINTHFKPFFGTFKLGQIKELHIKKYINDKLMELSPTTVRKHVFVLKEILHDALKLKSPCLDIKPPKPEKYVPYILTEEEFQNIHTAVKGTRDEPIILLAAWCGLRRGEIFALKWDDINWDNGTIRVDEARALSEDGYINKKPKSDNGLRSVAVPQPLMTILKDYRVQQAIPYTGKGKVPESKKAIRRQIGRLLKKYSSKSIEEVPEEQKENFLSELKELQSRIFLIRPDHYSTYFGELIKNKKLPPVRFHDLRHYHATWLYRQGIPDQYAAQRLGHDIHVLKGIYQHLGVDVQAEIDEKIKAGIGEQGNKKGTKKYNLSE